MISGSQYRPFSAKNLTLFIVRSLQLKSVYAMFYEVFDVMQVKLRCTHHRYTTSVVRFELVNIHTVFFWQKYSAKSGPIPPFEKYVFFPPDLKNFPLFTKTLK